MAIELLKKLGIEIIWPDDAPQAQGLTQKKDKPLYGRALREELEKKAKELKKPPIRTPARGVQDKT